MKVFRGLFVLFVALVLDGNSAILGRTHIIAKITQILNNNNVNVVVAGNIARAIVGLSKPNGWNLLVNPRQSIIDHFVVASRDKKYGHVKTTKNAEGVDDQIILIKSNREIKQIYNALGAVAVRDKFRTGMASMFGRVIGAPVNIDGDKDDNAQGGACITVTIKLISDWRPIRIKQVAGFAVVGTQNLMGFIVAIRNNGGVWRIASVAPILEYR